MDVIWTTPALNDIDRIQDFIAFDSPVAAFRLASDVIGRTNRLLNEAPMSGRKGRVPGTREFVVSGTAFIVVYRVPESIEILAVVHGARGWPESFDKP